MSKAIIDERVVEMKFDNKEFEKNIAQSLSTLDKLKAALNLKPVDSLKEIGAATKNFNMDGVKTATEECTKRFSAMEIVGITALANIANRAVNCGVQLVKSLSIAPIKDGFNEYEMKMGSIQTIMASTGESIQKVNGYLNELNTYSDKTIYSFADMTNNIGKFTNSGVKLHTAVKAIQGIANEAAVSGANANEASRAMYNFAQALSAGYVKLIDWKSIENANMATVEFKQQLLDTAEAMGTVVKIGDKYQTTTTDLQGKVSGLFDATHGFNDALSNQWMTTEVLSQTLENYATDTREMTDAEKDAWRVKMKSIGYTEQQIDAIEKLGQKAFNSAQDVKTFSQLMDTLKESVGSGWAQTSEIIFGNLEEAKQLWTGISNVVGGFIGKVSDARNNMLQTWKDLGGRKALIDGIIGGINNILAPINAIRKTIASMLPSAKDAGKILYTITLRFKEFNEKIKPSPETIYNIYRASRGLFSVFKLIAKVLGGIIHTVLPSAKTTSSAIELVASAMGLLGDMLYYVVTKIEQSKYLEKSFIVLENVFNALGRAIQFTMALIKKAITGTMPLVSQYINDFKNSANKLYAALHSTKEGSNNPLDSLINRLKELTEKLSITKLAMLALTVVAARSIAKIVRIPLTIKGALIGVIKGVGNTVNTAQKAIKQLSKKSRVADIIALAGAFSLLAFGIAKIASCPVDNIVAASVALGAFTGALVLVTILMNKMADGQNSLFKASKKINSMVVIISALSASITALAFGMAELGNVKIGNDSVAWIARLAILASMIGMLVTSAMVLSKMNHKIPMTAISLIALAGSMILLAKAAKTIASIEVKNLLDTILILTSLFGGFALLIKVANKASGKTIGIKFVSLAFSLGLIVKAISAINMVLEKSSLLSVLKSIAVLEIVLWSFVGIYACISAIQKRQSLFKNAGKEMSKISHSFMAMALSLLVISNAIKKLSAIERTDLVKGTIALTSVIGFLTLCAVATSDTKHSIGTSILLISLALNINVLLLAIKTIMKAIDKSESLFIGGMASLALIIAGLSAVIKILGNVKATGAIASSIALVSISVTLLSMAATITMLAKYKWTRLLKTVGIIALVLSEITAVIMVLRKMSGIRMTGAVIGLVSISAGLIAIAAAVMIFNTVNWASLGKAGLALAGLSAALVVLSNTCKLLMPATILAAASSMAIMSGSLLLLAAASVAFCAVNWNDMLKAGVALVSIATTMTLLSLAVTAVPTLGLALQSVGLAFVTFSLGMLAIGGAAVLFSSGVWIMVAALEKLVPLIEEISTINNLSEFTTNIAAMAGALTLLGLAGAICLVGAAGIAAITLALTALSIVCGTFGDSIKEMVDVAIDNFNDFVEGVADVFKRVKKSIDDFISDLADVWESSDAKKVIDAAEAFGDKVGGHKHGGKDGFLGGLAKSLIWGCPVKVIDSDLMTDIATAFSNNRSAVNSAEQSGWQMGTALANGIADAISAANIGNIITSALGTAFEALSNSKAFFIKQGSKQESERLHKARENAKKQMIKDEQAEKERANKAIKQAQRVLQAKKFIKDLGNKGQEQEYKRIEIQRERARKAQAEAEEKVSNSLAGKLKKKIKDNLKDAGINYDDLFINSDDLTKNVKDQMNSAKEAANGLSKSYQEIGNGSDGGSGHGAAKGIKAAGDAAKQSSIDMDEATKKLTELRDGFRDTVSNQMDMFNKMELKAELSPQTLLENMRSNLEGVQKWMGELNTLVDRGITQELYKKLADLGPQGYETLHAFTQMTDEQLKQANDMFAQSLALPDNLADNYIAQYTSLGQNTVAGFVNGLTGSQQLSDQAITTVMQSSIDNARNTLGVHSPSTVFLEIGKFLIEGLRLGISDPGMLSSLTAACENVCYYSVVDVFRGILTYDTFHEIGVNVSMGLANGINDSAGEAIAAAESLANQVANIMRKALDIHSPSRVTRGIGRNTGYGFAFGIEDTAQRVADAAAYVADKGAARFNTITGRIQDAFSALDLNPVITPELDMSDVENQLGGLSANIRANKYGSYDSQNEGAGTARSINFTQNNYSPKALSRYEIYRNTQNQLSMLKGVLKTNNA